MSAKVTMSAKTIVAGVLLSCLTGLALGWMVGLSKSSVVGAVLAALLGAITGLIGALYTLPSADDADPTKVAERDRRMFTAAGFVGLLVIGIAIGATFGAITREGRGLLANWLNVAPQTPVEALSAELEFWAVATGLEDSTIAARFLVKRLEQDIEIPGPALEGGFSIFLYGVTTAKCDRWERLSDEAFRTDIESQGEKGQALSEAYPDDNELRQEVMKQCSG